MKKTRSFLLTAGIALATAFTFSCSGDDGGGGDGGGISNLSNLPLSFDGELKGKIDVFLLAEYGSDEDGYDTLPAGKIENGKLSLNLPPISSKYRYESWYYNEGKDELSIVPQNLTLFHAGDIPFCVTIPGKSCCIYNSLIKPGMSRGAAIPVYNSANGTVTGTRSGEVLNLNLSQGWQFVYVYVNSDGDDRREYWVTDFPRGATLEWELVCDDY